MKNKKEIKDKIRFTIMLIISFFILSYMTSQLVSDYSNLRSVTHEKINIDDFTLEYPHNYNYIVVEKYYLNHKHYNIGLAFLLATVFIFSQEILKNYRELKEVLNK